MQDRLDLVIRINSDQRRSGGVADAPEPPVWVTVAIEVHGCTKRGRREQGCRLFARVFLLSEPFEVLDQLAPGDRLVVDELCVRRKVFSFLLPRHI